MARARQFPSGAWRVQAYLNGERISITRDTEDEADRFAMNLLFSDDRFNEHMHLPVPDIARALGVSEKNSDLSVAKRAAWYEA